ncbi:hypothetical protein ACFX12_013215 [Malus domestica]
MTETIARVNEFDKRNHMRNVVMGLAGIDEAESVGCAQWLRSTLCSSPSAAVTPPLQARRLALPRARHSRHHDQNQRRASLTAVKRLAGHEARRPTLYLMLVTPAASAPPPWLLPLNVIDKTKVCQLTPKDILRLFASAAAFESKKNFNDRCQTTSRS